MLDEEQQVALTRMIEFTKDNEPVLVLQGHAGTGKTFLLKEFIKYLDKEYIGYVLCAPTHKAKLVIEEATGCGDVNTVHSLLALSPNLNIFALDFGSLEFKCKGKQNGIPRNGIVIIDEASMINDEIYKLLLEKCSSVNAKLYFSGDIAQLQPVGDKKVSEVFKCNNIINLTKIHRQSGDNELLPLLDKLRISPNKSFTNIEDTLFIYDNIENFVKDSVDAFRIAIEKQDVNYTKVLAYTNARIKSYNRVIAKFLFDNDNEYNKGEFLTGYENFNFKGFQFYNSMDYIITEEPVPIQHVIPYYTTLLPAYNLYLYDSVNKENMRCIILSNTIDDATFEDLAKTIENIRLKALYAPDRKKASYFWKMYYQIVESFATPKDLIYDNRIIKKKTFDFGYACTVHKSQGSSYNNVFVDMNNILKCKSIDELRQMEYVSLSRTKTNVKMFV
jgi:exodeoxyribonuclease-5